jgi:hypothetical protein
MPLMAALWLTLAGYTRPISCDKTRLPQVKLTYLIQRKEKAALRERPSDAGNALEVALQCDFRWTGSRVFRTSSGAD